MKFSIRDLMFVTVIAALVVAWRLHYQAVDAGRRAAILSAERSRSVLATAKLECEQLNKDVEFFKDATVAAGVLVHYHRKTHDVDWKVLDEPIPAE